ncbi:MAG TPA: DUF4129 domain-containing protein [Crenotrichaceae bacterium]|nr:DUF4129 domain-containing protein [Crenotrichaceae bacterium]
MTVMAGSERLVSPKLYVSLFIALLASVTAQASLRASLFELQLHIVGWGVLLALGLTAGWVAAKSRHDDNNGIQNVAALIGIIVFIYQSMNNSMEVALSLLLVWLLIAMATSLTNRRTLYFTLLASFCLILYAVSLSKESLLLIYILIYFMAVVVTLVIDYHSARTHQSLAASRYQKNTLPVTRIGLVIGLPIILVTSAIYLLVPRPAATHYGFFLAGGDNYYHDGKWQEQIQEIDIKQPESHSNSIEEQSSNQKLQTPPENTSDLETVDSSQLNHDFSLNDSLRPEIDSEGNLPGIANEIVLYMQGARGQYLRGTVFDQFDGQSWHTLDQQTAKLRLDNGKLILKQSQNHETYNQYTITTRHTLLGSNVILVPPESVELRFPGSVVAQDAYGVLYSPKPIKPKTIYSVHTPAQLLPGRPYIKQTTVPDKSRYLQLPKQLPARIKELSNQLTSGLELSLDKALVLEDYLRKEFKFSYQTVISQNKIPLDDFLFKTKYGHCEYFATALAILLRTQDIPARLVTGYSVTTFNPITGYYEARVLDGHAWVEAWIAGTGWVTFEPTAAYALPKETPPSAPAKAMQDYYERLSVAANQFSPGSAEATLYASLKWFFEKFNQFIHTTWQALGSALNAIQSFLVANGWWICLVGILGYIVNHYLFYRIKTLLACYRVKQLADTDSKHVLFHCYHEMESMLNLHGLPRDPSWTLRQYKRELSRKIPELKDNFNLICTAYNALRYNSELSENTTAETIKTATLEILKHPYQIPFPAQKLLEPLLVSLGYRQDNSSPTNQYPQH